MSPLQEDAPPSLFLIALGLCCCARAFSVRSRSYCLAVVCGFLTAVASLVAEHGLQVCRLSSCCTWAWLP